MLLIMELFGGLGGFGVITGKVGNDGSLGNVGKVGGWARLDKNGLAPLNVFANEGLEGNLNPENSDDCRALESA